MSERSAKDAPETGKREALLDAALELFAERGFHGTAVPLVAARAGVASGTVYRYFASKEALVNALFQTWKERLGRAILDGFPVDAPPRRQFRELWRRLCRFAVEEPRAFDFLELHHHAPYLDERSLGIEAHLLGLVKRFVEQAQAEQAMKPVAPELLMALVWGAFVGLVKACRLGYLKLTPELVKSAENLVWEAIRI